MPQVDSDLYLISDRLQSRDQNLKRAVEQALLGGVRLIQLREKDLSTGDRFELGLYLRELTRRFDAGLVVNGDAALALALDADGVHLPQDGLPVDACRKLLKPHMLIGLSTHTIEEAKEGEKRGADFITFGPVYHTPSKARYGAPVGVESLRAVCAAVRLPIFALGGIRQDRVEEVLSAGAAGVALISAVLSAPDVAVAASEIAARLRQARSTLIQEEKEG